MKKLYFSLLSLLLITGCTSTSTPEPTAEPTVEPTVMPTEDTTVASTMAGIGGVSVFAQAYGENADMTPLIETTYATIVINDMGKIEYVDIDVSQQQGLVDENGVVVEGLDASLTKAEKMDDYGMAPASPIGKEWYEQIDALETYMIGKTYDEALGGITLEDGIPTNEDLVSSVTIDITNELAAVAKAYENAVSITPSAMYKNASYTTIATKDATADANGNYTTEVTYALVGLNDDGSINFAQFDTLKNQINFKADGTLDLESSEILVSKKDLMEEYGMAAASPIGKEWYEQVASYEEYLVGKTIEDAIAATDENGKTTDADLMTSATISLTPFTMVLDKIANN